MSTSTLKLPSKNAASFYAQRYNRTIDYVKENFVKINIFFKEMNYESIDQVPGYGFSSLLADIGGNMGLFIGASVLTVIELFDFVYEIMKVKCGRLVRKFDLA